MLKKSLIYACILGFIGFVTSFGAHIVAVNLPVYAEKIGIGVAMIGILLTGNVVNLASLVGLISLLGLSARNGIPLILGAGEPGKEILSPLAVTMFGGLLLSLVVEIVIRPGLFMVFGKRALQYEVHRFQKDKSQKEAIITVS